MAPESSQLLSPGMRKNSRREDRLRRSQQWLQNLNRIQTQLVSVLKTNDQADTDDLYQTKMLLSLLSFVFEQCFGSGVQYPRENIFYISLVVLITEVFILRGICMELVQFFIYFMALDNSDCPKESGVQDGDNSHIEDDDNSDFEEDDCSDSEEECSDNEEDEEVTKENDNVLRLEGELLQKNQLIAELKKTVEGLTQGRITLEQNITDLERLNQEKERKIYSVSAEMQKLKNEMTEKLKDTELQIKESEDKDQKLIILENTVVVLQMEKETLHRDLQQTENSRTEMQSSINKLSEDLKKLRKENGRKQIHIESLYKENENKTLQINHLEEELQVLTTQQQMAQENLKQLDHCKIEIADKNEQLEKSKEQNLQKDREILRLQNECTQKEMEVVRLLKESKADKPKANEKLNEMTRRTVQLEFELAETKEELETMEFEKLEATLEIERLQEETLAKDAKITSLETQVETLKGEKESEEMEGHNVMPKENEASKSETNKMKKVSYTTRCLRKPQINCKALYQRMDSIEEKLRQISAPQQPSTGTRRHPKDPVKAPTNQKPLSRKEAHHKMRLESAARLQTLERESEMVRRLYKINSVT